MNQNDVIFETLREVIKQKIKDSFSQKVMKNVAQDTANRIKIRTRTGKGVKVTGADPEPLKALSAKYKNYRRKTDKLNRSSTTPGKSNLTFTGQLLDSIYGDSINERSFFISIKEDRNDGVKNSDIVEGQEKQGRKFFYFSRAEIKSIYNAINNFLRKEFKL